MTDQIEIPVADGARYVVRARWGRVAVQAVDPRGRPGSWMVVRAESVRPLVRAMLAAARAAGHRCHHCGGPLPEGRGRFCSLACQRVATHLGWLRGG